MLSLCVCLSVYLSACVSLSLFLSLPCSIPLLGGPRARTAVEDPPAPSLPPTLHPPELIQFHGRSPLPVMWCGVVWCGVVWCGACRLQAQEGVQVAFENIVNYVRMLTIFGNAKVRRVSASWCRKRHLARLKRTQKYGRFPVEFVCQGNLKLSTSLPGCCRTCLLSGPGTRSPQKI